jgi:ribosomal protein S18 acetylase RimI-like enzyme
MPVTYRTATQSDIPALARLRSEGWGTEDYWIPRIAGYMIGENNPQQALPPRVLYVAVDGDNIIGFIAGHLTRRLDCEGELEWIDITAQYRRKGTASELVRMLATWFAEQDARKICVDPGNQPARMFYAAIGAEDLNAHWMYWKDISTLLKKA